jgi:hypothetical protein
VDTRHDRPKLFRGGSDADAYCDADHRSIRHLNCDGRSD